MMICSDDNDIEYSTIISQSLVSPSATMQNSQPSSFVSTANGSISMTVVTSHKSLSTNEQTSTVTTNYDTKGEHMFNTGLLAGLVTAGTVLIIVCIGGLFLVASLILVR